MQNIGTGITSQSFNASGNHQQSQNNSQQSPAVSRTIYFHSNLINMLRTVNNKFHFTCCTHNDQQRENRPGQQQVCFDYYYKTTNVKDLTKFGR